MASALITFAVICFVVVLMSLRRHARGKKGKPPHLKAGGIIDVEIFCGLLNRNDWHYVRKSVPKKDFKCFQRKRIRLALSMLERVKENTDMIIELAGLARLSSDPLCRKQADELIDRAIGLRLNLLRTRFWLCVQWLFPIQMPSLPAFAMRYRQLWGSFTRFQDQY